MANLDINDTLLNRLRKVAILAERGDTDGERAQAERVLNLQLAKYGLTLEDVLNKKEEEVLTEYTYRYKSAYEEKIIVNAAAKVFGHKSEIFKSRFYRRRNSKCELYIQLNPSEHAIFDDYLMFLLNIYRYNLEKTIKNFFYGFLENQQLYSSDPHDEEDSKKSKGKYDEMIDMFAIAQFSKMNMGTYTKKLTKENLMLEDK